MKDDETSSPAVAEAEDEPVAPVIAVMMLMALQHGAASDGQLRTKGLTARRQNAFIERGHLRRHAPGVVIDPGSPETWHRLAMAATLAPGADAVLSGAAAARLHGFDGFADINRIIVVIPHGRSIRAARGVTVVTARYLPVMDLTTVDGIRTLTIAATLVSLARVRHSSLFQALDSALRDGSDAAELRREFERHRRNGCRGPADLVAQLDQRVDTTLPRSWFQRLASGLLKAHGISMIDEWTVRDTNDNVLAELDLACTQWLVGVECQSWRWHATPSAQRADAVRKRRLRRLGWDIIELWWSDLDRVDEIVADIRAAIERAQLVSAGEGNR